MRMAFAATRHPNAITSQWLIDNGFDVGLQCYPGGRHMAVAVPVRSLPFALERQCRRAGRLKCKPPRITENSGPT